MLDDIVRYAIVGTNVATALMMLYIMQASTCSPLRMTTSALLRELHRLALCALAFALVVAASTTARGADPPREIDVVIYLMLMLAALFWILRYLLRERFLARRRLSGAAAREADSGSRPAGRIADRA